MSSAPVTTVGSRATRWAESLHAAALGLWGGALVASGAVAAIIFPTMRDAQVHMPDFASYSGAHWPIAAGQVMNKVFLLVDGLGIGALVIAVLTLAIVVRVRPTRHVGSATAVRLIALGMLIAMTGYAVGILRPDMQHHLHAFWLAAKTGDAANATLHRAAFDARHPTASFVMGAQLVLIVVALMAGIMCATNDPRKVDGV